MTKISFTYFDVGGVSVLDFSSSDKWEVMKRVMGVTLEQDKEFDAFFGEIEIKVCKGDEIDSYIPMFKEKFNLTIPADFSILQYMVDRIEANPSIWPMIQSASERGGIGLLTDMYPHMLDGLKKRGALPTFAWQVIVDSSVVGVKKPMPEIYQIAEEKAGVPPSEILFVENMQINLDGAIAAGWQTFLYDPKNPAESSYNLAEFLSSH